MSFTYSNSAIKKYILIICGMFLFSPLAQAQKATTPVEFIQKFGALQEELPRESIYLHTDRQWYYFGDRIWFSAYVTAGKYNLLSELSSVLHVELFSPDGTLINRAAVKIEEGRSKGSLSFKNFGKKVGTYQLRAYTIWALNFGDSYVYTQNIQVITEEGSETETITAGPVDLQFFPESGHLVQGVSTRVGFKAIGSDGLGKEINGKIFDQGGEEILEFSSEHLGMGSFNFTPKKENGYYAMVDEERINLPEVQPSGTVMNVVDEGDQFRLNVKSTAAQAGESLFVFGHVGGEIYHVAEVFLNNGGGISYVPKDIFATGIIHFAVLDNTGTPLAERLTFNKNQLDYHDVTVSINKSEYDLRSRVDVTMNVYDVEGNQVPATGSFSVFDDEIEAYNQFASNITSHFNLETELKGHIEQAGYYFSEENTDHHLDLLLLTQGWRAYDMNTIKDLEEISLFSMPEEGFKLSGNIKSGFFKRVADNAAVVISSGRGEENMVLVTTDEHGEFEVSGLQIEGSEFINVKANDKNGNDNVTIEVDEQFDYLPEIHIEQPRLSISSGTKKNELIAERAAEVQMNTEQFIDAQMVGELEDIDINAERISEDQFERNLRFASSGSQRIDLDEKEHLRNLTLEQLLAQIPGVTVSPLGIKVNTGATSFGSTPEPLIIVDGMESDLNLTTTDVKTINVFRRAVDLAFYGARGTGGVIVIRTRSGSGFSDNDRGLITAFVEGYQTPTTFYSPKYGIDLSKDDERADHRIGLHWEPKMDLSYENAKASFWTNDIPSTYRIVVQGLTHTGLPFIGTNTFNVVN